VLIHRLLAMPALLLALAVTGCGGGGEEDSSSFQSQSVSDTGTAQGNSSSQSTSLTPTWDLSAADPSEVGLSSADVQAILDHVFSDEAAQSAVLVKDGYVIGERHSPGADKTTLGTSWSVAKSFYAMAVGIAIDEGWLEGLDQPASEILTEWADTNLAAVTIRQILEMRAGLAANSSIFFEEDQTGFALRAPKIRAEGERFVYSNSTSQLIEPLLRRATGLDAHSYLREKLLTPIGIDINLVGMWFDRSGVNPLTYMGLDLTPLDMARFGLMVARGGEWDGTQIVSSAFVQDSLRPSSAHYGLHWWILNDAFFAEPTPVDIVAALGLDGQKIYVWPEQDIVLVFLTQYEHSANQGFTLSDLNFPNTCTARNSCPGAVGGEVPTFDQRDLIDLLHNLVE